MTWNAETEASLRKWVGEGFNFAVISEKMFRAHGFDVTNRACSKKAERMGIYTPGRRGNHDGQYRPSRAPFTPRVIEAQPEIVPVFDTPHGAAQAVAALHTDQCKYPIGEPANPDFHFCGGKSKKGSVYCEAHAQRCEKRIDPNRKGIRRGVERRAH